MAGDEGEGGVMIVFLDVDGVLNSTAWLRSRPQRDGTANDERWFDPEAVARLNRLTQATGARIVVSSSWRQYGEPYMADLLARVGVVAPVIGVTPVLDDIPAPYGSTILAPVPRGREIQAWIDDRVTRFADDIRDGSFVILDDCDDMAHLKRYLVRTDHAVGLTDADVERAKRMLGRQAIGATAGATTGVSGEADEGAATDHGAHAGGCGDRSSRRSIGSMHDIGYRATDPPRDDGRDAASGLAGVDPAPGPAADVVLERCGPRRPGSGRRAGGCAVSEQDLPFVAFGNEELAGCPRVEAGDQIMCAHCGEAHELEGGERVLADGSREPSDTLLFVTCGEYSYLAAIRGALLFGHTAADGREGLGRCDSR